jgi:WD40 repeat protein
MTLRLWDIASGQQIGAPLTGHTDNVRSVAFSPDGSKIISGSGDASIRVWDASTGQQIGAPFTGQANIKSVLSVAFSPDGSKIVSGADNSVFIWDGVTGQQIGPTMIGHTAIVVSVAFSPDGSKIVSCSDDKTIRLWQTSFAPQPIRPIVPASAGAIAPTATPKPDPTESDPRLLPILLQSPVVLRSPSPGRISDIMILQ